MSRRPGGNQRIPRPQKWREGNVPSWHERDLSVLHDAEQVQQRVLQYVSSLGAQQTVIAQEWKSASKLSAVLIPLVETHDGPGVVLTRRADHLRNHKGEISFPGGRMEADELPHETALREAEEEIGLPKDVVTVLGELHPIATFVSNSHITPVVATLSHLPELQAEPGEVARIFTVSLHELARPDTYRNEWWETPRGDINIHFFELDDETIWGATGRLLHQLLDGITSFS